MNSAAAPGQAPQAWTGGRLVVARPPCAEGGILRGLRIGLKARPGEPLPRLAAGHPSPWGADPINPERTPTREERGRRGDHSNG